MHGDRCRPTEWYNRALPHLLEERITTVKTQQCFIVILKYIIILWATCFDFCRVILGALRRRSTHTNVYCIVGSPTLTELKIYITNVYKTSMFMACRYKTEIIKVLLHTGVVYLKSIKVGIADCK